MKNIFLIFSFFLFGFTKSTSLRVKPTKFLIAYKSQMCHQCITELTDFFKSKRQNQTIFFEETNNFVLDSQTKNRLIENYSKKTKCEVLQWKNGSLQKYRNEQFPFVLKVNKSDTVFISYSQIFNDYSEADYKEWNQLFLKN
jgi:hypothetical protein